MLEYFPRLLLNSTFVGVRTRLIFFVAFLSFFWLSGQNVNPFELHQGLQDTTIRTSIDGSDVVVEVQPVPVINQTVTQMPAEISDSETVEPEVTTESQNTAKQNTQTDLNKNAIRNPFELIDSQSEEASQKEILTAQGAGTLVIENDTETEVSIPNQEISDPTIETVDTLTSSVVVNPFNVHEGNKTGEVNTEEVAIIGEPTLGEEEVIKPEKGKPIYVHSLPAKKNTFVFWLVLLSGLLLSFLLTGNRKIINEILKSLSNVNYMKLFQKEERNGASVSFIILYIIYVLNASIFLRFAAIEFEIPLFGYNFIFILLAVLTIILLRHFSLNVVSYLRKRLPDAINYSFIIAMVNAIVGLILIPVNLLIAFGPESMVGNIVFLGVGILIFAFILKWLRGFVNSARIIFGDSFHFLLYLCTCEIVPICICVGFLRNLIN